MTKRYNYMMDLIISIVSLVGLILNFNLFNRKNKIKSEAEKQSTPVPEITDGSNG